jgi:hypothetical protein
MACSTPCHGKPCMPIPHTIMTSLVLACPVPRPRQAPWDAAASHRVTTAIEYAASLAQQSTHYEPPATGWHLRNLQSWQRSTLARSEERDAARVSRHARVTRGSRCLPVSARRGGWPKFDRSFSVLADLEFISVMKKTKKQAPETLHPPNVLGQTACE